MKVFFPRWPAESQAWQPGKRGRRRDARSKKPCRSNVCVTNAGLCLGSPDRGAGKKGCPIMSGISHPQLHFSKLYFNNVKRRHSPAINK